MRRTLLVVAGSGLAVVGGLTTYFLCPSKLPADPPKPTAALNHVAAAPSETSGHCRLARWCYSAAASATSSARDRSTARPRRFNVPDARH